MRSKGSKKKIIKIVIIAGVVLVLVGGGVAFAAGRLRKTMAFGQATETSDAKSYEVKVGTISTSVSGTGTLEPYEVKNIDLLSLVDVDTVYVEAGDSVQEGDLLATVDPVTVGTALQTLQEELDSLDDQIADVKDDTISSKITAGVAGRVKKIYGAKGDTVASVIKDNGALLLLSLDGKMAVDIENGDTLAVGDEVTVTLQDGSKEDGTVESVSGTTATVTLTDNGPAYGEEVSVSKDGSVVGKGSLYIHSELAVTGYAGTISAVSVKENSKVSGSTTLFTLTDLPKTAEYESLVAERAEVAEALQQVIALYSDPNIYAETSGTVQSVNCEGAEYVETASAAADTETTETTETSAEEATGDTPTQSDEGNKQMAATGVSGGFTSLSYSSTTVAVTPMSAIVTEAAEDDGSEEENTESKTEETEKQTIGTLSVMTVTAPVTGEALQTEITAGDQYSTTIGWNPAVAGGAGAGVAYTATVKLQAKDGYCFDTALADTYAKYFVAATATVKTEVAADGESVTFTAVFPSTQEETKVTEEEEIAQTATQTQSQTTGGTVALASGGSVSGGSSAGVSVSSASAGTAAAATEETNLNNYTGTTTIFGISTDEKMSISVSVDEQDIGQLSEGISAQITLDAIDNETFTGTVTSIHTISNTAAGGVTKYTAEVTFDKTEDMLQGMNASVVMTVSSSENCLMIPEAALQEDGKTTTVYTTYDESTGEYGGETEVTTGVSDGTSVEILSGLSEGDTVYYSYTEDSGSSFGGFDMGGGAMMGGGDMPSGGNGGGDMPSGNGGGGGKDMPSGGPQ